MTTRRREPQSSHLLYGLYLLWFGAVLLLFILTAKRHVQVSTEDAQQASLATATLQQAIDAAEARDRALDQDLAALDPQPKLDHRLAAWRLSKTPRSGNRAAITTCRRSILKRWRQSRRHSTAHPPTAST